MTKKILPGSIVVFTALVQTLEERIERWAFDPNKGEFKCPMCNTLSNLLVPHIPDRFRISITPTISKPMTLPELVRWALDPQPDSLRGALVDQVPHPYIPNVLSTNVRRYIDSLGEVCEVSWGSYSLLASDEERRANVQGLSRHGLRSLMTAWSTLSYTLATNLLQRCITSRSEDSLDDSARLTAGGHTYLRDMLFATREVRGLFDPSAARSLEPTVLRPLADLLTGQTVELVLKPGESEGRQQRTQAMKCFPLQIVLSLGEGEHRTEVLERMKKLHSDMMEAQEGYPEEVWPMLTRPLLSWDLGTLAVGAMTLVESSSHLLRCGGVLALARLAQILMEPSITKVGGAHSGGAVGHSDDSMMVDGEEEEEKEAPPETIQALRELQRVLLTHVGQAKDVPDAVDIPDILFIRTLYSLWAPFLREVLVLLELHQVIEVSVCGI